MQIDAPDLIVDRRMAHLSPSDLEKLAECIATKLRPPEHVCLLGMDPADVDDLLIFVRDIRKNHNEFKTMLKRTVFQMVIWGIVATFIAGVAAKLGFISLPGSTPAIPK
jgi:hypothetical protein